MPSWTKEQTLAINEEGTNIIVSAGAGSGKTAVLTERVIRKLKSGVKISELLILTFTNNAAKEMVSRIRREIEKNDSIKDNLNYLDSAYITTFDSYTLSLVKKYSYLLNVSNNLSICDNAVMSIIKKKIMDDVFLEYYENKDVLFYNLLDKFTIKNDDNIKSSVMELIKKIDLISDKEYFFDNYFDMYLSDFKIDEYIKQYELLIKEEINNIENNIMLIGDLSYEDYYNGMVSSFHKMINAKTYDEIRRSIPSSIPRRPKDSEELIPFKEKIDNSLKIIKSYLRFNSIDDIKKSLNDSKDYIKVILNIIKEYYKRINKYKSDNDLYEFTDIELMAIKLLKENHDIREEIKLSFKEICVDEYQDTNDLQEEFVNLIASNNVYMVGDIKQSIYGFRNANPSIFKNKYDSYSLNNGGKKIDLLSNFRSRCEVLTGINDIFNLIMDNNLGGADYRESHQMIFGNTILYGSDYNKNYDLEIYNYNYDSKEYSKEEIEAFIIGRDIIDKINNKYEVIDKNTHEKRGATYSDFCIIMDRGTSFPIYSKIFEYLGIPLNIYEDKKLTNEIDILIINNLIGLILKIKDNIFDKDFIYDYTSIARSYLFSMNDNDIFNIIKNKDYKNTIIYKKCLNIIKDIDKLNNYELLNKIIEEFDIYENTIKVGNIENTIIRINNLKDIANNLSLMGFTIEDFKNYLDEMIMSDEEITYKGSNVDNNAVKMMNIHKSKGLEFPICYFSGYHKAFNTSDIKTRFTYSKEYGIITPYFNDGIDNTILKDLLKDKYIIDNISEEIRLFYVALTRCKEKMIIVASLSENDNYNNNLVDISIRKKYNSFLSILNSIRNNLNKYIKNIDLSKIDISKEYKYENKSKSIISDNNNDIINLTEIKIDNSILENDKASVSINNIISKEEYDTLNYGTKMHQILEYEDFLNSNNEIVNNIVNSLNITSSSNIYKEHEFIFDYDNKEYHGIIDLLIVEDGIIKIVDYKLKDISEDKYKGQLNIYFNYIKSIYSDKVIEVYLYSIIDNKLEKIEM